ncbi:MAG: hypothetical protein GY696_35485 [Gammaproteobacteria bacterium]|nr:hypothetical protein [Gammaproteobacteria bacterium]
MEMRQTGEDFAENARKTRPEPLTDTLTVLKSDSERILAMIQEKQAKDQESQRKEEALQALEQVAAVLGGQQRSMDHPRRVDTSYRTMSAWQLEDRGACWGRISPNK